MNTGALIMYAVATALALAAAYLFLTLRRPLKERQRYAAFMAGTMAAAGSFMLFAFATALWRWGAAS
jgi:predicted permease